MVNTSTPLVTPERFQEYYDRAVKVREIFERLGRGAQQETAHDLRVAATRISAAINCRTIDFSMIELLEKHFGIAA